VNDRPNQPEPAGPAPADARPRESWPLWKRIVAYLILALLALASIWYIDLKAHQSVQERGHSLAGSGLVRSMVWA
jgi:hypothetical protein